MVASTTPNTARKKARDHAAKLLDAEEAQKRRREAQRRKRITDNVAEIAGNDAEIAQLTLKIDDLRADSGRRLAAILADGVAAPQVAAMTERDLRDVRAAVKTSTAMERTPATKRTTTA